MKIFLDDERKPPEGWHLVSTPGEAIEWLQAGSVEEISLVLRYKPETIGLNLDPQGWADIDSLLAGCRRKGQELDREKLFRIMEADDKQRFQFSPISSTIERRKGFSLRF